MSKVKTLQQLIADVRLRAGANSDNSSGTGMKDDDIALLINDEMDELVTFVQQSQQDYLTVISKLTPIANVSVYRIETRALYQQIKEVYYIDNSNNTRTRLSYIDNSVLPASLDPCQVPLFYLIRGSDIVFYPNLSTVSGYYEIWWSFKPNTLVKSTECRQVSNVNTTTKTITFSSSLPAGWTTNNKFDVHSKYSGAEIKQWNLSAATVAGSQIVFTDDIDTTVVGRKTIEIGDWVCLEEEAALPCLPVELHNVLVQAAVVRLAESRGDLEAQQAHESKLDRMLQVVKAGISHRTDDEKVVVNNNSIWNWVN